MSGSRGHRPLVVRIVGDTRSGTTVLGSLLGELPDATFVGEATQIWAALTTPDWRCSCGVDIASCPFWNEVRERSRLDADFELHSLRSVAERRLRVRPGSLLGLVRPSLDRELSVQARALERVYEGIAATAGVSAVVDSTKSAPDLLLALRAFRLDVKVLHLVRDPRAVAHSRTRRIRSLQPDSEWIRTERPLSSGMRWMVRNALHEAIGRALAPARHRVRYEDLMSEPARELAKLAARWEVARDAPGLIEPDGEVAIGPRHAVNGNPRVLARKTAMRLEADDEWRSAMPRRSKAAVCIPASPLMPLYRYVR